MINLLIGFMIGSIFTMLVGSYAIGLQYQKEIKRDNLIQELLAEINNYEVSIDRVTSEMNEDYWG